nr:MAG TPA: hypothetical protein [Caudoviricetes sp.]
MVTFPNATIKNGCSLLRVICDNYSSKFSDYIINIHYVFSLFKIHFINCSLKKWKII